MRKFCAGICSLLVALVVVPVALATDSAVDVINVAVPESCTLSTPSSTGETYDVSMINGQYKNDIGKTRLTVFCNTNDSFAIYAVGYSNDTLGNTEMVNTGSGTGIATGTATSGDVSNWAMKVEAVTGGSYTPTIESPFNDFAAVPSSYAKIAEVASATSSTVEGAVEASYAIYVARGQASGSYTGKVRYTVVHPASAPAPSTQVGLLSITNMQEMTAEVCDASTAGDEKQLIDTRDNKSYWVAKLADNKCWMTQNLDLDLSTSTALTPSDSDVTANWTPTRATINASSVTDNYISGWENDYNTPYSVDPGTWYYTDTFFDSENCDQTCNFLNNEPNGKFAKTAYASNGEHGHVGNYYNWSAAVAMNSTSGYTSDTLSNIANNPQTSICPKGWRLPTISNVANISEGSTNEFGRLNQLYNSGSTSTSQNLEKAPLYFVRSGDVGWSQQSNAGYSGYYWSSSVGSSYGAYALDFSSDYVSPTYAYTRFSGHSVRCVSR